MPTAAIAADVMVGFPGETDVEFAETQRMIEELPFTYLHVFTYSARPGTPAAEHANQVPVVVARERNRVLREIASRKKATFMQSLIGTVVEAITLRIGDANFTGHPAPVTVEPALPSTFVRDLNGTDVVLGPLVQSTAQRVLNPAHDAPSTSAG